MNLNEYKEQVENGRKNFIVGLNRTCWKFYTKTDYMMAGFTVGVYAFTFEPSRNNTEKFIDFLKNHVTIDNFPIFPSEIAEFLKENSVHYKIRFKQIPNDSLMQKIKNYLLFKKTVIQYNI